MSKAMVVIHMPETCSECPFSGDMEEMYVGRGLYKKIVRCKLAGDEHEDPWRDLFWTMDFKEEWCPLKSYEED